MYGRGGGQVEDTALSGILLEDNIKNLLLLSLVNYRHFSIFQNMYNENTVNMRICDVQVIKL